MWLPFFYLVPCAGYPMSNSLCLIKRQTSAKINKIDRADGAGFCAISCSHKFSSRIAVSRKPYGISFVVFSLIHNLLASTDANARSIGCCNTFFFLFFFWFLFHDDQSMRVICRFLFFFFPTGKTTQFISIKYFYPINFVN